MLRVLREGCGCVCGTLGACVLMLLNVLLLVRMYASFSVGWGWWSLAEVERLDLGLQL